MKVLNRFSSKNRFSRKILQNLDDLLITETNILLRKYKQIPGFLANKAKATNCLMPYEHNKAL